MTDRSALVAALAVAYPLVYILFLGEPHCGPACVDGTAAGAAAATAALLACAALAAIAVRALELPARWRDGLPSAAIAEPSRAATALVVAVFACYLAVLAVSATRPAGVPFSAVVASVVVYPFVWLLYWLTFPLALAFGALGVAAGSATTLVVRGVVLVGGFGLSLVYQLLVLGPVAEVVAARVAGAAEHGD